MSAWSSRSRATRTEPRYLEISVGMSAGGCRLGGSGLACDAFSARMAQHLRPCRASTVRIERWIWLRLFVRHAFGFRAPPTAFTQHFTPIRSRKLVICSLFLKLLNAADDRSHTPYPAADAIRSSS